MNVWYKWHIVQALQRAKDKKHQAATNKLKEYVYQSSAYFSSQYTITAFSSQSVAPRVTLLFQSFFGVTLFYFWSLFFLLTSVFSVFFFWFLVKILQLAHLCCIIFNCVALQLMPLKSYMKRTKKTEKAANFVTVPANVFWGMSSVAKRHSSVCECH